jgi:hypothetical protein
MRVEGISYSVDWSRFYVGQSFFVPCIDHKAAKAAVAEVTDRLGVPVEMKVVIEEGVKGLRVWRV